MTSWNHYYTPALTPCTSLRATKVRTRMQTINGYRVWLEVDGEELKEYPGHELVGIPSYVGEIDGAAQSFVVSMPGKKFCICWEAPPDVDVEAELALENIGMTATQLPQAEDTRIIREPGGYDQHGIYREFLFEMLSIDLEGSQEPVTDPTLLGTIEVILAEGKLGEVVSPRRRARKPKHRKRQESRKALTKSVDEKTKVGQEHTVKLGDPIENTDFVPVESMFVPDERWLFLIHFNSRDLLEAHKKIPTEKEELAAQLAAVEETRAAENAQHEADLAAALAKLQRANDIIAELMSRKSVLPDANESESANGRKRKREPPYEASP